MSATSSATATTAGGDTITLTATTTNATAPVTWTLNGPGTLSATQGESITYTPPAADDLTADAGAQIKASLGDQQQTLSIDVAMLRGRTWSIAEYPKSHWVSVLDAGGLYVVAGSDGTMISSTDLIGWTAAWTGTSNSVSAVVQGGNGFVAVGYGGPVAASADGNVWKTLVPIDTTGQTYFTDAVFGAGRYVAVGNGRFYSSTDGASWKESPATATYYYDVDRVVFGNGRFVASGNQSLVYSSDGLVWQPATTPGYLYAPTVAWGNGRFLALSADGYAYTSLDGSDWQLAGPTAEYNGKLIFSAGKFYLVSGAAVVASDDGLAWTEVFHNPQTGDELLGFTAGPAGYVVAGSGNLLQTSADAKTWSTVSDMPSAELSGVDCMDGLCVAIGSDGTLMHSTDGAHWTASAEATDRMLAITHGNGMFVGVSASKVYTSTDGNQWAVTSLNAGFGLTSVAYGDGRYLIAGVNGLVLTSADAKSWTAVPSDIDTETTLVSMTYADGKFVAAANPGVFLSSTDGRAWTRGASVGGSLTAITSGAPGYVAVGWGGLIWQSRDGLDWTAVVSGTSNDLYGVVYANGQYVAVGAAGTLLISRNGLDWVARNAGTGASLVGVAYSKGSFIAVGASGTVVTSDH